VGLNVLDVNWRIFSARTSKQTLKILAGGQQITLEALHQLQNMND